MQLLEMQCTPDYLCAGYPYCGISVHIHKPVEFPLCLLSPSIHLSIWLAVIIDNIFNWIQVCKMRCTI
jgi:hypothetical protein